MTSAARSPVRVGAEHIAATFDAAAPPAVEVEPGAVVRLETSDAILARLAAGAPLEEVDLELANAVTGPVYVRGAEPGDALRVDVLDVEIARAWVVWIEGFGPLGSRVEGIRVVPAPIGDGRVTIAEGLPVPIEPMIGCIGVAPASGPASTMRPLARTGGNMDLRDLVPGASLWLPVEVSGALLSAGDLHAAMGHGEPAFVAIEAAGTATLRVQVEKSSPLTLPRLRRGRETLCIGMGGSYPEARRSAVEQAFEVLTGIHGLAPLAAYAYLCARVGLRPAGPSGSMVDGLEAVVAAVPDPG